jgi:hypothetical protein
MGILQGKKINKSARQSLDPFESTDEPFSDRNFLADLSATSDRRDHFKPNRMMQEMAAKSSVRRGRNLRNYLLAAALCGASGFAVARFKPWNYFSQQEIVYAYFEVRALDTAGRPIAGAIVKNAGKRVGTTDSFGEWRRYMRVPLGSTVPVTLAKKMSNQLLVATKNFAVPPTKPEKSEIELRGSVQLQVADLNDTYAKSAVSVAPNDMMKAPTGSKADIKEASVKDNAPMTPLDRRSEADLDSNEVKSRPEAAVDIPAAHQKLSLQDFVSNHEKIAFEASGSLNSPLQKDVLPALKKRAAELGLRVDPNAEWKVRLTSLLDRPARSNKEGDGLIMVTSFDGESGGNVREFLRNYQSDANNTARGILYILSHHINKNVAVSKLGDRWVATLPASAAELWKLSPGMSLNGIGSAFILGDQEYSDRKNFGFYLRPSTEVPCVKEVSGCELKTRSFADMPPVPNWSRLRLKASALGKEPVKIFVSGYEAKVVGDKVYEYWGQDKSRANVTVVQSGRIIYRGQIVGDSNSNANLALANISRR